MSQVAVHIVESPHSKLQPSEHVTSHDEVAAPHVVLQPPGQPETCPPFRRPVASSPSHLPPCSCTK